jgi:hypothetical protein
MRLRERHSGRFPALAKRAGGAALYARLPLRSATAAAAKSGAASPELPGWRAAPHRCPGAARLGGCLHARMHRIAPNPTALAGERTDAQLKMAPGPLASLAKAPASAAQLLGAEKAQFNALKKRKNTPKSGAIHKAARPRRRTEVQREGGAVARGAHWGVRVRVSVGRLGSLLRETMERRVESAQTGVVAEANLDAMERVVAEARRFEQTETPVAEPTPMTPPGASGATSSMGEKTGHRRLSLSQSRNRNRNRRQRPILRAAGGTATTRTRPYKNNYSPIIVPHPEN